MSNVDYNDWGKRGFYACGETAVTVTRGRHTLAVGELRPPFEIPHVSGWRPQFSSSSPHYGGF